MPDNTLTAEEQIQDAQAEFYLDAQKLIDAYYQERAGQADLNNGKWGSRYSLGPHDSKMQEIVYRDLSTISPEQLSALSGRHVTQAALERLSQDDIRDMLRGTENEALIYNDLSALESDDFKKLVKAAGRAMKDKGLKRDASGGYNAAKAAFTSASQRYLDVLGEPGSGAKAVKRALKEAKPPGMIEQAWGAASGAVGGGLKSAGSYFAQRGFGGAAQDAWNNTVGFATYVAGNPHQAMQLGAQGLVNSAASIGSLVPATVKVIWNNTAVAGTNGVSRLFNGPPVGNAMRIGVDFNKTFSDVTNSAIVGNGIRTALLMSPTAWVEGIRTMMSPEAERAERLAQMLPGSRGIVAEIKHQQGGALDGAQKVVLFGGQAVGEVGSFIAVSVPTFGVGGATLAAVRAGKVTKKVLSTGWDDGARLGWKVMRPYSTRQQRVQEAGELAANRLAIGQKHTALYERAVDNAANATTRLEKAKAAWGEHWHGWRANRMIGGRNSRIPLQISTKLPLLSPVKIGGMKYGIAGESFRTGTRFATDAARYQAAFGAAAADDSLRSLFRWRTAQSTNTPALAGISWPNLGLATRFRHSTMNAKNVADGGMVAGWNGGLEVAGGSMLLAQKFHEEAQKDAKNTAIKETGQTMREASHERNMQRLESLMPAQATLTKGPAVSEAFNAAYSGVSDERFAQAQHFKAAALSYAHAQIFAPAPSSPQQKI